MRQGPGTEGARVADRLVTARHHALARHRVPARWRVPGARQGGRRQGPGPVAAHVQARPDGATRIPGGVGRRPDLDGAPRCLVGHDSALRHHVVPGCDPQISAPAGRGAGGVVLPADVRPGLAAVLPGRDRQGAGAPVLEHARRADHRLAGDRGLRNRSGHPADLPVRAHHQPHRRRAGRPPVPPPVGPADGLLPGAAGRRFGGARARAGEHPQFPHQFGAHPGHRPGLRLRVPGRDVLLFAAADGDRAGLVPVLHRDLGGGDAALPAAARTRNSSAAPRTRLSWSRA